jgi:hypothetical protein
MPCTSVRRNILQYLSGAGFWYDLPNIRQNSASPGILYGSVVDPDPHKLTLLDRDPYWESRSGSRTKDDTNLQTNLISGLSERLLYLRRYDL